MKRSHVVAGLALALALVATARARQEPSEEEEMRARVEFESFAFPALAGELKEQGGAWKAFFENETLSCGVYRIPAGAQDGQKPHAQDEVYYVVAGRSKFTAGEEEVLVAPGQVLFVAAEVEHRFHEVEADLELLVFFSKAEPEEQE